MMKAILASAAVLGSVLMGSAAQADDQQNSRMHYHLPLNLATEAAEEALKTCEAKGYWVTATVVDMDGIPQLVMRGDKATVHTGQSSFRKAFTVITLGPEFSFDRSSKFFELTRSNPYAPGLATVHNVLALPGAVAIMAKGEMVAALGIGGAPGGDKDEVCAQAGVSKIAGELPQ